MDSADDEKMRVAVLTDSISRQAGGLYWSVRALSQEAIPNGWDVAAFAGDDAYSTRDVSSWVGVDVHLSKVLGPRAFGFQKGLVSKVKRYDPHIVHQHGLWMYPSIANLRLRNLQIPYIISPHGMLDKWALRNSSYKKRLARFLYEDRNLRGAKCLRALCDSEMRSMRDLGIQLPIAVIPNGVDLPSPIPRQRPDWFGTLAEGTKVAFFLGRIHPKKGLIQLLKAWSLCRSERCPGALGWALVISGWDQNDHQAELEALAATLGIADSVKFIGPSFGERKSACLQYADAFVLPSLSEGLPMAILEAWSYGLPVVMTPECNLTEGFEADAAIEISPHSESVANGLRRLFAMTDCGRGEMGARGLSLVKEKFQWDPLGKEMAEVYRWMVEKAPPPACIVFHSDRR